MRTRHRWLGLGAHGFIAGFVIAALRARGWRVLRGVHDPARILPDWAATLRVYNVMETMK